MIGVLALLSVRSTLLTVGPGKRFARIESAVAAARPGDTIQVFPSPDQYAGAHVLVRKANLAFNGVGQHPVAIDGGNFDYSGVGAIPRAIFQFDPGSDRGSIRNFELSGAHNSSRNGAGVRINQAKDVTISSCLIRGDDLGIMSNGRDGDPHAAENQMIDHCEIRQNGNAKDNGADHNLYLGGTSATIQFCEIAGALTGHNIKSRAHFTLVKYCQIHDSANLEVDLVDAYDTERPESNVVLLGNLIVKSPQAQNRTAIHFGQEKGKRQGTLFMVNNTVVTPFASPVLAFDSPQSSLALFDNAIVNTVQASAVLVAFGNGTGPGSAAANANWISKGYDVPEAMRTNLATGKTYTESPFIGPSDYRLNSIVESLRVNPVVYLDGEGVPHSAKPEFRYTGAGHWLPTKAKFLGAG